MTHPKKKHLKPLDFLSILHAISGTVFVFTLGSLKNKVLNFLTFAVHL